MPYPLRKHSSLPEFIENPNPEIYLSDNYVVVDFETTNRDKGSALEAGNSLVLSVFSLGKGHPDYSERGSLHSICGTEYESGALLDAIRRADYFVAHNTKFELQWLARCGADLRKLLPYCTQIGEYCISGNRRLRLGLDTVARRYEVGAKSGLVSAMIKGGICPSEIPRELLIEYCETDVKITERIFLKQRQILKETGLLNVAYARNLFTPVLADLEAVGLNLDPERVRNSFLEFTTRIEEVKTELGKITGGINAASSKQLREFLYETLGFPPPRDYKGNQVLTRGGKLPTDKGAILGLTPTTDRQRDFISVYRKLLPLKKKVQILEELQKCCTEDGGRLFANFNQTVTQTHRLSSSGRKYGLQFHNFPRDFKPLFYVGEPSFYICEGDAPQLEFRVAADLGGDTEAIRAIRDGVDVHGLSAQILGVSRQDAKAYTFKPLYGGNSGTPRERKYYEAFRQKYKGIYDTQVGWTYEVLASKHLRTVSGLIFYWPDTKVMPSGYVTNTPSIFNYPIQMFATADIIPLTTVILWHKIDGLRTKLINTIHDSVIAKVPEEELVAYKELLIRAFTKDIYVMIERLYGRKLNVPLGVGIKTGTHWGEGEEEKHEAVQEESSVLQDSVGNEYHGIRDGSNQVSA